MPEDGSHRTYFAPDQGVVAASEHTDLMEPPDWVLYRLPRSLQARLAMAWDLLCGRQQTRVPYEDVQRLHMTDRTGGDDA